MLLPIMIREAARKSVNEIASYLLADDGMLLSCGFCHVKVHKNVHYLIIFKDHLSIFDKVINVNQCDYNVNQCD